MRVIAVILIVSFFSAYAWRNWFASLCVALVLMAVLEHPDMPKSIGGIQGMNLWNVLIFNVTASWLVCRSREGLVWDAPRWLKFGLGLYLLLLTLTYIRLALDPSYLEDYSFLSGFSDYWVNSVKFLFPAIMLFDGARGNRRVLLGLASTLAIYFLLAVQVVRWVPLDHIGGGGARFAQVASKLIENEIGYNRVTLSMLLGGASWAIAACFPLATTLKQKLAILFMAGVTLFGQLLTGGRTGYVSWLLVGLVLCVARWRKLLPLIPVAVIVVFTLMPAVRERILFGVGQQEGGIVVASDDSKITSGRTTIWPFVIDKIGESPVFGFGRLAMRRTGLHDWLLIQTNEDFPHPHNAYLEQLLDNGLIGFFVVVPLLLALLYCTIRVFIQRHDLLFSSVGAGATAMLLSLLIGAMGGQTFYPREGYVGLWALVALAMRGYVQSYTTSPSETGAASGSGGRAGQHSPTNANYEDHIVARGHLPYE